MDVNDDILEQAVKEALEDIALAEAMREGRQSDFVEREEIFDSLGDER